ncbi:MAG: sigma-54 dependent transcriptional regulator [Pseudomonadota bacterium]
MKTLLIVDDQANSLKVLTAILRDEGYMILPAAGAGEALEIFNSSVYIDAVLSDLKMPKMDGLELFRKMNEKHKPPPFIIMTAYGTVKSAVQAVKCGVTDYLIKPLDYEELSIVLERVIRERETSVELDSLKEQFQDGEVFHGIIGNTPGMRGIFEMVRTVGPTDVSVLICGETGTGKELLARSLHLESRRRNEQMVCINSAALSENLLEAELFGHVKGAFTGADSYRKGRLEMADNSTLFLDEIGQMSVRLQAKLLRFLQEMTFEPVGSVETRSVNARIIAATNLDLREEIRKKNFLRDLLYRIEVISIHLPPLRDRKEDIYLLVHHFIRRYAMKYGKAIHGVEPEVMKALAGFDWPGNIRELKNCIARAVILSKKTKLGLEDLPDVCVTDAGRLAGKPGHPFFDLPDNGIRIQDMEKELIQETLMKCGGNKSHTAVKLGISRKTLYEKMARLGIGNRS